MGSMVLPHLQNAWQVDQAILSEDERLVVVRFGKDSHPDWYVSLFLVLSLWCTLLMHAQSTTRRCSIQDCRQSQKLCCLVPV